MKEYSTVQVKYRDPKTVKNNQFRKSIKFSSSNSPAAARIHVSQEDENVIENFQMHEHPDR